MTKVLQRVRFFSFLRFFFFHLSDTRVPRCIVYARQYHCRAGNPRGPSGKTLRQHSARTFSFVTRQTSCVIHLRISRDTCRAVFSLSIIFVSLRIYIVTKNNNLPTCFAWQKRYGYRNEDTRQSRYLFEDRWWDLFEWTWQY